MLDKVILVHYINVGNRSMAKAKEIMQNLQRSYVESTPTEDRQEIIAYFVPVREGESRIECVYPRYVSVGIDETVSMQDIIDQFEPKEDAEDIPSRFPFLVEEETADEINEVVTATDIVLPKVKADELSEMIDNITKRLEGIGNDLFMQPWPLGQDVRPSVTEAEKKKQSEAIHMTYVHSLIKEVLNQYLFEMNTDQTRKEIKHRLMDLLGPVTNEMLELTAALARARELKMEAMKEQKYENAARARDNEKGIQAILDNRQMDQLVPYTDVVVEMNSDYPHELSVRVMNGDKVVSNLTMSPEQNKK